MGVTYLIARLLRIEDKRALLLGGILPDVTWIVIMLTSMMGFDLYKTYLYLAPFHTPVGAILLSILIASCMKDSKKTFLHLCIGFSVHMALDLLVLGENQELLYPLNMSSYSMGIVWPESTVALAVVAISAAIMIYAVFKEPQYRKFEFKFRKESILVGLMIAGLLLSTAILIRDEYTYFKFSDKPELWENKEQFFHMRYVVGTDPLTIAITNKTFEAEADYPLKAGDMISFSAVYKKNKLYVDAVHVHDQQLKIATSLVGLVFFSLLFFPWPRNWMLNACKR